MNSAIRAPRRVGILGGMGPAAAIDLQAKILAATPATGDQEHLPIVTWNVPQVPDRVAAILGSGPSPLPAMIEGARILEAAGCEAFAIACNTAHHWAGPLAAAVDIPLLHIADAAMAAMVRRTPPPACVGLLATRGTLASGFLGGQMTRRGIAWIAPTDEDQERYVNAAIVCVKAGESAQASELFSLAAGGIAARGADLLLLACTELPIAARGASIGLPVVDATQALAEAVVAFSLRH